MSFGINDDVEVISMVLAEVTFTVLILFSIKSVYIGPAIFTVLIIFGIMTPSILNATTWLIKYYRLAEARLNIFVSTIMPKKRHNCLDKNI